MVNDDHHKPDPIVEDILLDIVEDDDDGMYRGFPRSFCLRCVYRGLEPPGEPAHPKFAFCNKCMQELDRAPYVRAIMRHMRRRSKPQF